MNFFIGHIATISHQKSFQNPNWLKELIEIDSIKELEKPNYKDFIAVGALRRLSSILKSSIAASIDCKNNSCGDFDAIIVGTGLGCLADTEKFLNTVYNKKTDFISPTAFIQSTHNTIAGQISLHLKNHSYNITHTQNHLSFEHALLDAIMCLKEGKKKVLIGAADEKIDFLEKLDRSIIPTNYPYTNVTTFLSLSSSAVGAKSCKIVDIEINYNENLLEKVVKEFLKKNNIDSTNLDLLLHSGKLIKTDGKTKSINYLSYSGINLSASAFAVHFANDYLIENNLNCALIVNTFCSNAFGLVLLQQDD